MGTCFTTLKNNVNKSLHTTRLTSSESLAAQRPRSDLRGSFHRDVWSSSCSCSCELANTFSWEQGETASFQISLSCLGFRRLGWCWMSCMNVTFKNKSPSASTAPEMFHLWGKRFLYDPSVTTGSYVNGEQQVIHPAIIIISYQSVQLYYVMTCTFYNKVCNYVKQLYSLHYDHLHSCDGDILCSDCVLISNKS